MTYTAVLVACLISAPTDCRSHEIILTEWMPTMQALEAQQRAAEWLSHRPELTKKSLTIRAGRSA